MRTNTAQIVLMKFDARWGPKGPGKAQGEPKMTPREPKMASRWPKMAPRWPQGGPGYPPGGSQNGSNNPIEIFQSHIENLLKPY